MWSYLITVNSDIEADIINGLLEEAQIQIQKKYPGSGNLRASYGIINGVELWVPSEDLEEARELLTTLPQDSESSFESSTDFSEEFKPELYPPDLDELSPKGLFAKPASISFILIILILLYWLIKGFD
ncbi:DUF2007 domain-containing protein [Desulfitobacterium sp.]|uniref:putative signal transducing protein n=1 Tax=Desulfitobacterium sp. TaxID=49981 RepID=UPI002C4F3B63|nr:DUF2007 domain-containing protein [Desulfitobacterium sp.]HVJ48581.1 DUF2007 domain-containing protein [Desulfitobacterium sp.]